MSKAFEALEKVVSRGLLCTDPRRPGAAIQKSSPAVREALQHLTSDELANIRPDAIFGTTK